MATFSSAITSLVSALITALNARSQTGASDYQVWLAQGNTGTLQDYRNAILGGDVDYATQFTNQLGSVPTAGLATEAQGGISQFATLAEALAGASSQRALSALRYANVVIATSLSDLNTKAAALPTGSIIALAQQDFTASSGGVLYRSIWYVNSGAAQPLLPLFASSTATLTYLVGLLGSGKTYTALGFDPGVSEAVVSRSSGNLRDLYRYLGTSSGFKLWEGYFTGWSYQNAVSDRNSSSSSFLRLRGEWVDIHMAATTNGTSIALYAAVLLGTSEVAPAGGDAFISGSSAASGWSPMQCYVTAGDYTVRTLTAALSTNQAFQLEGSYRRAVPTS